MCPCEQLLAPLELPFNFFLPLAARCLAPMDAYLRVAHLTMLVSWIFSASVFSKRSQNIHSHRLSLTFETAT